MNWKSPITLLVLIGLLLGAAYYGWRNVSEPDAKSPTATAPLTKKPKCATVEKFRKGQEIGAEDVVVNVFNAGSTTGLATETLDSLVAKGFTRGEADNAPGDVTAGNVTIVTKQKDDPTVRLVALQFKGTVEFAEGPDLAPGVDVFVGDGFRSVDDEAQRVLRLERAVSTCTSVKQQQSSAS